MLIPENKDKDIKEQPFFMLYIWEYKEFDIPPRFFLVTITTNYYLSEREGNTALRTYQY